MQENFLPDRNLEPALMASLSAARLGRYLKDSGGNRPSALRLYDWNVRLSQSLYVRLQIWEITLRNRMNGFLSEKFGKDWPHRSVVSQLRKSDLDRLRTSVLHQKNRRGLDLPTTDMNVADLSAGFWVAMFAQRYSRMFGWLFSVLVTVTRDSQPACHSQYLNQMPYLRKITLYPGDTYPTIYLQLSLKLPTILQ
jgi:hypothetical protein